MEENAKYIQYLQSMGISKRQLKIAKQLQKDLSDIFRLKLSNYFKNTLVTITRVDISPDLSLARIYVSVFPQDKSQEIIDQISARKSELRGVLGNRIGKQVRKIPDLIFLIDHGSKYASDIDEILSNLDIPPESE